MNPLADRRAQLLVLASGLCALAYQSAWIRQLRLLFGASTAASAAVLGIFMGGMGLGAWRLAKRVETHPRPLALYAKLEAGVALLALLSIPLLGAARAVYLGLGGEAALGPSVALVVRLALAALVLGAPAFLMGGTLPAIVRAAFPRAKSAAASADGSRTTVGRLYGLNTLGALFGVAATSFWSLETLGISRTILCAVGLNLAAALWAAQIARAEGQPAAPAPDRPTSRPPSAAPRRLIWFAAALFGFVFFAMELVWYRVLAPLTGGTTYGFGFVLGTALAGIGIGGLMYQRRGETRVAGLGTLALCAALEACAMTLAWALGDRIPLFAAQLRALTIVGTAGLHVYWLALTSVIVLPAALVAGYQFPLLVACLGRGRQGVGRDVSTAYAFNTGGAVCGAIFSGFGLIPLLGVRGLWLGCVLTLVALSLALLAAAWAEPWRTKLASLSIATITTTALGLGAGPTVMWLHNPIGAGRLPWHFDLFRLHVELRQPGADLIWAADGKESSVAVLGRNAYSFRVNGKTDGNATGDAATVVMAPLIGAALHPDPQRGLVIGLGTGMSAGWLAQVPSMQSVDVVELEPALVEFARMCAPVNHDALDNPRVNLVIGDAREWVQTVDRRWDVVMSEPSNPYRSGVASLFSADFYESLKQRMSPRAVFVQWLQGYEIDAAAVATVLATLQSVFPAIDVFVTSSGDYALVARMDPQPLDLDHLHEVLAQAPYDAAMAQTWGVHGVEGLLGAHVAGPGLARSLATNPAVLVERDDRPRLEFGFARQLGSNTFVSAADAHGAADMADAGEPLVRGSFDRDLRDEARHVLSYTMQNDLGAGFSPGDTATESRRAARVALADGDVAAATQYWSAQAHAPYFVFDQLRLGAMWADAGDTILARAMIERLHLHRPVDALLLRARLAHALEDQAELVEALEQTFVAARQDPWFDEAHMADALRRLTPIAVDEAPAANLRLFAALGQPFAVDILGDLRIQSRIQLARTRDFNAMCTDALAAYELRPAFDDEVLQARVDCYLATDSPRLDAAQRDLATYRTLSEERTLAGWLLQPSSPD